MSDLIDTTYEAEAPRIPNFLKVLCILTFVGSGIGILGAIYGVFTTNATIKSLENSQDLLNRMNSPMGDMGGLIEATKKWGMLSNVFNLFACGLCLTGGILMWKLKKIGYVSYLVGVIAALIPGFLMMGSLASSGGMMGVFMGASFIFAILLNVAFIIMYTVNRKHLIY
jgi:hypothetical protein